MIKNYIFHLYQLDLIHQNLHYHLHHHLQYENFLSLEDKFDL
jgi:hypothetical protein